MCVVVLESAACIVSTTIHSLSNAPCYHQQHSGILLHRSLTHLDTGMAAMVVDKAYPIYNIGIIVGSVLTGVFASTVALWVVFFLRGVTQRVVVSFIMGVAVCGMHYTGMTAVEYPHLQTTNIIANNQLFATIIKITALPTLMLVDTLMILHIHYRLTFLLV